MGSPILIYALFFLALAIAGVVIADWRAERSAFRRTLRSVGPAMGESIPSRSDQLSIPVLGRVVVPTFERAGRLSRRWSPSGAYERIEHELVLAGSPAGWDAERVFDIEVEPTQEPEGCICGEVLKGVSHPTECILFDSVCNPSNPVGTCMVSEEGACQAFYKYGTE